MGRGDIDCRYKRFCYRMGKGCPYRHPSPEPQANNYQHEGHSNRDNYYQHPVLNNQEYDSESQPQGEEEKGYYSPPERQNYQPYRNKWKQSNYNGHNNSNSYPNPRYNNKNNYHNNNRNYNNNNRNYNNSRNYNNHNNHNNYNNNKNHSDKINNHNHQTYKNHKNHNSHQDPILQQLCRGYHLYQNCKFGQDCSRYHSFLLQDQDRVKRIYFDHTYPLTSTSDMVSVLSPEGVIYLVKGQKEIAVFNFIAPTNEMRLERTLSLNRDDNTLLKIHENILFMVFKNKLSGFYDFTVSSLTENFKGSNVQNAHTRSITGIIFYQSLILLTCSLDGELKVWTVLEDNTMVNDIEKTIKFKQAYNPNNIKMELTCLYEEIIQGLPFLFVGTSHSTIFILNFSGQFFISEHTLPSPKVQRTPMQIYIQKVRYVMRNSSQLLLVMGYSQQSSYIFWSPYPEIDFKMMVQEPRLKNRYFTDFQIYDDLLAISGTHGVSFLKLTDMRGKEGCIFHKNTVKNMMINQYQLKNTGVTFPLLAVLEPANEQTQQGGSFSIFLIN